MKTKINLDYVRPSTSAAAKAFIRELAAEVCEHLEEGSTWQIFEDWDPGELKGHLDLMALLRPIALARDED